MKKRKIVGILATLVLLLSLIVTAEAETAYSAMIVQGNTEDVGDCKVFYEEFKKVPSENSYVRLFIDFEVVIRVLLVGSR